MSEVHEIDLTRKYIITFDGHLSRAGLEDIKRQFAEWVKNDEQPFLFLANGARLVKVEDSLTTEDLESAIDEL